MISYCELIKQRDLLSELSLSGVVSARKRLNLVNTQISKAQQNPVIFEPKFVYQKPGYNYKLLQTLIAQARKGSDTCAIEVQKYADWVIASRAVNKFPVEGNALTKPVETTDDLAMKSYLNRLKSGFSE